MLLAGLIVASLGCSSVQQVKAGNNDGGVVAGLCLGAAALIGAAGAVAWYCSETDDQMIARVDTQYRDTFGQYQEDMICLVRLQGYASSSYNSSLMTESVLHEFATHVWNKNVTQQHYRSAACKAQRDLQSCVEELRKRVRKLEHKHLHYEDQQRLRKMQQLLNKSEELLKNISWFTNVLETHRSYFNLYDTIDVIRSRYFQEMSILESSRYSAEMEIKRSIINRDNGHYAFRTFVINIKSDISRLESDIRALANKYPSKQQYAYQVLDTLVMIKNIVVNDPRYQQELYDWEQAELQRMRIEAEKARARAEQDRAWAERNRAWAEQSKANAMREQNRVLEERNRIERDRLGNNRQQYNNPDVNVNFDVFVTI